MKVFRAADGGSQVCKELAVGRGPGGETMRIGLCRLSLKVPDREPGQFSAPGAAMADGLELFPRLAVLPD